MHRRRFLAAGVASTALLGGCLEQAQEAQRVIASDDNSEDNDEEPSGDNGGEDDAEEGLRTVVDFEPASLPENLAVNEDGDVYLGFRQVAGDAVASVRVLPAARTTETDLTIEATEEVAELPAGGGGVTFAPDGEALYAVANGEDTNAVYRIPAEGGDPTVVASREEFTDLDAFSTDSAFLADVFVEEDRLLVTDSFGGTIFEIDLDDDGKKDKGASGEDGEEGSGVSVWSNDPLFDAEGNSFAANGVAELDGDLLVANSTKGLVARVPIEDDGEAGSPETYIEDEALGGADGITVRDEQLYVAVNGQNAVRRVSPSKEITTIAEGDVLDFPSDVIFGSDATEEDLFVANFAVSSPEDGGGPRLLRTSV
jgi:sugar lactone lactonase YvrE